MDNKNFSNYIKTENIKIEDNFWDKIISLVKDEVIPYQYKALHDEVEGAPKSWCIDNFKKASKIVENLKKGINPTTYPEDRWEYRENEVDKNSFHGWVFQDSDIYKWIEAVGFSLAQHPDKELQAKADECIDIICSAQLDNGYLDTLYIINDISKAFSNLKDKHELYCFGHMVEGAISYYNATGNNKLLNASCRMADLICETFNENNLKGYPGHEIAEMALVKLYKVTNNKRYLDTAKFFIEQRGTKPYYFDLERNYKRTNNSEDYFYNQAHKPVIEQNEAVGHAVRGVYLYSGIADVAKEFNDEKLYSACKNIWDNIETKKLYITGGIGSTVDGEAFSYNYDLPNDLAYCETCASIGLIFFARRMLEIEPNSKYADVMERALYNTVLSGMAEDGKSFFYVNPLEVLPEASRKDSRKYHIKPVRQKWFGCACCPPNLARLISSLSEYCYTQNDGTIFVHQYLGGKLNADNADITVKSSYLDDGKVSIEVKAIKPFTLAVRIPSWSKETKISHDYTLKDGYAYIDIISDTKVDISFEIKAKIIKCSNKVRANIGKVAIMRGAVVYCLEEVDNGKNLQMLKLSKAPNFEYKNGYIIADGYREADDNELYSEYKEPTEQKVKLKFIPYYRWGNRGENEMSVYVRIK